MGLINQDMDSLQASLPSADQEPYLGATQRRSRVSSIFQQKTIKPDDIDTDFLKHLAFATQRGSPIPAASEASAADQHTDQAAVMEGYQPNTVPSAAPDDKLVSEPGMQPADSGEFTLAKIEQSIAEIEAELGWTTDSASPAAVATADDSVKSAALPPGILSTGRPLASTPGAPSVTPPQGKRLSFMGDPVAPESRRTSTQHHSLASSHSELKSSITTKPAATTASAASAAAPTVLSSTTADSDDGHSAMVDAAMPCVKEVQLFTAEPSRLLDHSLSEASLGALSSQPLEGSASKRQLTSIHSMQSEASHDVAKRRTMRHSLSGKSTNPLSAVATPSTTYSGRYATRQLSGRASPGLTDGAVSPKRSGFSSPTASIHGGQAASVQQSSRSGSGRPATAVESNATLAGAAAVLKSHARPSSVDGAGWHLATGDGLPFSPRGSLVASSGGSRTLRPITSQQEALFDAEGNMLPRPIWQAPQADPLQTLTAASPTEGASSSAAGLQPGSKTKQKFQFMADADHRNAAQSKVTVTSPDTAGDDTIPAKQKHPAKHGMLSIVMFPCFCLRPRTTSTEHPDPQGSLRQRFATKEGTPASQAAASSKAMPAPKSALKQKQPNGPLASDTGKPDWDLGTQIHSAHAAHADDVQLLEAAGQGRDSPEGRSLQGAVSLAPKRCGLAGDQSSQQQVVEGDSAESMVSPAASFTSSAHPGPTDQLNPQHTHTPGLAAQPRDQIQSHEEKGASQQPHSAADDAAAALGVSHGSAVSHGAEVSHDGGGEAGEEAAGQSFTWGNSTGISELGGLEMTGRSASKSGTRRRKEWEGPDIGSPAEVSQSLEDIMLDRFPELQPLLLQSSFSNKQAPWRAPKSGHTSHAPSRGNSLGVTPEASFSHSRPESRQGQVALSHLGTPRQPPNSATQDAAYPAQMQSQQAESSSSMPTSMVQPVDTQPASAAEAAGTGMPLVEAAALGANSPGAVVHVPTSTVLSQADQIALRYQHQVQFQLQQAMGSTLVGAPASVVHSSSKPPSRRSPTKHRPFHLSDSPWKSLPADSAQLGQSHNLPSAPAERFSPRRGRSASKAPIRAARSRPVSGSPEKHGSITSKGKQSRGGSPVKRQAERQAEGQGGPSAGADRNGGAAVQQNAGTMSFGSYAGVSFSSFTPEMPAQESNMAADDEDDWADDSGKWGERTRPQPSALPAEAEAAQPKQSSISLADITSRAAEAHPASALPKPSHNRAQQGIGSMGANKEARHSYLSLLESLAQESDFGSPGNSDNDSSPNPTQAAKAEHSWPEAQQAPVSSKASNAAAAEDSQQHSEASVNFEDDAVEGLLPDEASDAHMHGDHTSEAAQMPSMHAAAHNQVGGQMSEEEEQPTALALALAALAATAAQKQAQQTSMHLSQPETPAEDSQHEAADADADEKGSVSSLSSGDVLADAAAAAAAAGLSRPHQDLLQEQLPVLPVLATGSGQSAFPPEPQLSDVSIASQAAEAGPSQVQIQIGEPQPAQQEGMRQRESASGDYGGPGSSGPSWSAAAGGGDHGIGRFKANQTVDYVGKSARRPKVLTAAPKPGRLHGLFTKLRRGGSKEEEELDSSRPASIAGPRPLEPKTDPSPISKSGSWIPKAFSRPQSETAAGSAGPPTPQEGHTHFADEPILTGQVAQPDGQDGPSVHGPLPSRKAPPETFTALPSLPVPAPIAADPVVVAPVSPSAARSMEAAGTGPARASSTAARVSKASGLIVVRQQVRQEASRQSSSESGSDDDISELSAE